MHETFLEKQRCSLWINGQLKETLIQHNQTLLEVIRYNLDLIGTKQGCDKGDCGACTVLLNNMPILSCISLATTLRQEDKITTIEGLGLDDEPDLLLLAFLKTGALQCGFCQPGMILSAKALLHINKNPSLLEIKQALAGNLCRCTGYTKIYLAVMSASLLLQNQAENLEEAIEIIRNEKRHLGDT